MKNIDKKDFIQKKEIINVPSKKSFKTYYVQSNQGDKNYNQYYDFENSRQAEKNQLKSEVNQKFLKSKEDDSNQVFFDTNNFDNSSIFPDLQKLKKELDEEKGRQKNLIMQLTRKNEQLKDQKQQLIKQNKQAYEEMKKRQYELSGIKHQFQEISQHITFNKEQIIKLKNQNQQYSQININLQKRIRYLQNTLKSIKQNRSIANQQQIFYQAKINPKEIYDYVGMYLKERSQQLINNLKSVKMSAKAQNIIQDFIQQILLINQVTLTNYKKNKNLQQMLNANDSDNDYFSIVNKKKMTLNKSIENLKNIQKQSNEIKNMPLEAKSTYTLKNMNIYNPFENMKESNELKNRSKSRKRIFE